MLRLCHTRSHILGILTATGSCHRKPSYIRGMCKGHISTLKRLLSCTAVQDLPRRIGHQVKRFHPITQLRRQFLWRPTAVVTTTAKSTDLTCVLSECSRQVLKFLNYSLPWQRERDVLSLLTKPSASTQLTAVQNSPCRLATVIA